MIKTLEIVIKGMPTKRAGISHEFEQFLVFPGSFYKSDRIRSRKSSCGLFLQSKDRKVGDVEFTHAFENSRLSLKALDAHPNNIVLFLDGSGFYLMEKTAALEISGELDDV
jgi:hypothetical protein